jgi:glycosyltransferase involved in cell wall biosynthesis
VAAETGGAEGLAISLRLLGLPGGLKVDLSIVVPAHNEDATVAQVVAGCRPYGEVIVVDDGSTDRTAQEAVRTGAILYRHKINRGYSAAIRTGLRAASGDVIALVDGDGQQPAAEVPVVVGPILRGEADMVIGSKLLGLAEYRSRHLNSLTNRALSDYMYLRYGVNLTHPFSGMRAMRKSCIDFRDLKGDRFESVMELDVSFARHGYKIVEVPRVAKARVAGVSHVKTMDGFRIIWRGMQLFFLLNE